ncbi:RWD domain-containing protein 2A [Agrilus planipennis]|uniref:RWD domain-containing protein 2A n=1 Tax=Agrilus planipennis TaxID=224129 RepID=A0A1W4X1A2_AGRPL|nr:RWD domain-containing protein 2A [Agrilus planipennis]XP_018329912.1 RWD domain-containing protein 2A [Agrilus planipennis]XP_018329913.1 RWD domain-containing protein 2A [Agrilus planipennis]
MIPNRSSLMTLSKFKENLETQLSEIEMLQSVYCNPGEFRMQDPSATMEAKNFIDNIASDIPPTLDFVINLVISGIKVEVSVNIPHEYPTKKPHIYVRNNKSSKTQHSQLNKNLTDFISELEQGSQCIFAALSWIQDNADKYVDNKPELCGRKSVDTDEKLVRMWLYSHHIYSKTKRREILDQANQLNLKGFCLPGKPGIICIEGPSTECNEWWQTIRNMGWKKLFVKIYEECKEDPKTFCKFDCFEEVVFQTSNLKCQHMDLGEFLKFLEEHKCGHVFKDLFGVDGNYKQ